MAGRVMNKHRDTSRMLKDELVDRTLSMSQILTHTQETQKYFQNILGPLSLFSHADKNDVRNRDRAQEERAPTSPSDEITDVPASLSEFCQQLRKRITQQSPPTFSSEDRETLAAVMMAELSLIWQDLRGLPADPTLTSQENKQLRRQTFAEVLCICEHLYLQYLHLLETLARRAVFSHQVNCSRLAAHMAVDLSSLLNVHSIQRSVAAGIKAMRGAVKLRDGEQGTLKVLARVFPHIKPKKGVESKQQNIEEDLIEIQEKIGELDLERVYDLMPCHLEPITEKTDKHCCIPSVPAEAEQDGCLSQSPVTRLKGCNSMPDLQRETLQEELEMATPPARPLSPLVLLSTNSCSSLEKGINPAEDLKRLLQDTAPVDSSTLDDSDIPPLIRASATSGSSKLKELTQMLQKLEEEEERTLKNRLELPKPPHPQSEVESVNVSTSGVARIAAARVSDRVLPDTVNISMYPPVYNNLTGEIEPASVTWLDRNLSGGAEVKEVYKELSKNLSSDYLHFDEDPMIEPAVSSVELLHGLKCNHEKKLMNPSLKMPNPNGVSHRKRMDCAADRKRPVDVTSRAYAAWHQWWKSNLSLDDYLNYITNKESDYLSVVFHLYDSDDSDDEDEKRKMLELQREKNRKQRERMDAVRMQKQAYQPGLWNVNTVLMGGLWKEPVPDEMEGPEITYSMPIAGPVDGEEIQTRLERIWTILCLPETQRLDMAIKYSSNSHRDKLQEATAAWEKAAQLIQQREHGLYQLEQFEKIASDPSRFFQQGYRGTSAARMEEAKHREKLESQIAALDKELSKTIHHILVAFNDTVTYKGRPYREKMRWDRIEMLYWLQQERRAHMLEKLMKGRGSLPARLPPLESKQSLYPGTHPGPEDPCSLASQETIHSPDLLGSTELCIPSTSIQSSSK